MTVLLCSCESPHVASRAGNELKCAGVSPASSDSSQSCRDGKKMTRGSRGCYETAGLLVGHDGWKDRHPMSGSTRLGPSVRQWHAGSVAAHAFQTISTTRRTTARTFTEVSNEVIRKCVGMDIICETGDNAARQKCSADVTIGLVLFDRSDSSICGSFPSKITSCPSGFHRDRTGKHRPADLVR